MYKLFKVSATLTLASCIAAGQTAPQEKPDSTVRIWVSDKEAKSVQGPLSSEEILKEIGAKCVGVVLTDIQEKADYRLEASRAWCCTPKGESRGYQFTLFNREGDAVYSTKTHTLGNAIKDVCKSINHAKAK